MNDIPHRYFIIHKPRNMVSQFVSSHKVSLLGDLGYDFPEGTHAIGRLDNNSEGLLLLTTNKKITRLLFKSDVPHKRRYLVQVRHVVTSEAIQQLQAGVNIRIKGGGDYITSPCEASVVEDPTIYLPISTDIIEYYPFSWILVTLTEGKFRQVRKMTAAVGFPTLRLIRVRVGNIHLGDLKSGQVREVDDFDVL